MRIPLYAALFRRPAAVVRHRRHVGDAADLETQCVEGAHRGFSSWARPFDAHLEILYAAFLCCAAGLLCRHLGGERGRFPRALEPCGPEVAQARALPCRSVMVTMVLLDEP